jgi:1-aminocyclopropane-1-carboxylate deaminase
MHEFSKLNAPVQKLATIKGVELWVKRDDLIHPEVSGNKWRKLKYYLKDFRASGKESILTFGGAFSNHLAATAALGKLTNIPTKALVRGEEVIHNPTLDFCRAQGMEVESISRKRYATKDDPEFLNLLATELPQVYVIPEGGKGPLGLQGCTEILDKQEAFDYVAVSAGTGTTAAGIITHKSCKKLLCFSSLKGGHFLRQAIKRQLLDYQLRFSTAIDEEKLLEERFLLVEKYHFGGYGKVQPELIQFMNKFYKDYQLALDPVYTGKLFFGLLDQIDHGFFQEGSSVLAIHTGGLQGINGMNERLLKKGLKIDYAV